MQGARLTWEQLQQYDPAPNTRGAGALPVPLLRGQQAP